MSEVISFRLDKDNPREAQARTVLKAWADKGYSVRHVLTEALLAYHGSHKDMDVHELSAKLDQMYKLLQQNRAPSISLEKDVGLSDRFLVSIKNASKPGVSLG
jgi:hypothetical protein